MHAPIHPGPVLLSAVAAAVAVLAPARAPAQAGDPGEVSYHRQIAPLLKARCAGCHHPGKRKGELDLSTHAAFLAGGESGPAVVPGDPAKSPVLKLVTGSKPEMPAKGDPLTAGQVDLLRRWIAGGALQDGPAPAEPGTGPRATYPKPPPVPAIAYSPDGAWLAVGGYHEVLLHSVATGGIAARLVGGSPRVQSLQFSADSRRLAVAAGRPGRSGEVQIWDVAGRRLHRSWQVGTDTLFGVSLSPDGTRVAVGCADRTVRMLRIEDGEELLLFRNHADWVLGTCFTRDGKRLVSGGRDKALKIIELADGRFVDDINSPIDPVLALARHPQEDTVVYAGGLGVSRIYRISDNQNRTSARRDTNLHRALERQDGPVYAVAYSADGALVAAAGTDPVARVHDARTGAVVGRLQGHQGPLFAVAFHPDGKRVTTAGYDGVLRTYEPRSGALLHSEPAVPVAGPDDPDFITSISLEPAALRLADARDQRRVLVTGHTVSGRRVDLTGQSDLSPTSAHLAVDSDGYLRPRKPGSTVVRIRAGGLCAPLPVEVVSAELPPVHFCRDVMPVLAKAGCNAGTCHGAQNGKNGFALSLRGFDPEGDYRALVHDLSGRRFDAVQPDQSLMLLKPIAAVPHEGEQVFDRDSRFYDVLLRWIAEGTRYASDDRSRVTGLRVVPERVDLLRADERQSVLVVAEYADGSTADVTRDAVLSVSDTEVAGITAAEVRARRRGESAVLVRYEGSYATAPITVMGDRSGFAWRAAPVHNFIDEAVDAKLRRLKILPAGLCTDAEFVRRLYLDLTGRPPTPEQAKAFVGGQGDPQARRNALIDELIGSPAFVDHWANKWADLLQCNSRTLGEKGVFVFREWIARCIAENKPYDDFVRELLTASGSTFEHPAANYMRALSDRGDTPDHAKMTEDVTQTFLGVRFNCCKCHNHPFERWTQDQYYAMSAHFARVRFKNGTEPGELVVYDSFDGGETVHPRTATTVAPQVPYPNARRGGPRAEPETLPRRRDELGRWLTSPDNRLFARSYVNRVWSYFFGIGVIEPVDDIRAGNPPSNPELLDRLEQSFLASGFDFAELVRTICRSRTWQSSLHSNRWNADDHKNFSHAIPRRLSAEQLLDAVAIATGVPVQIAGLPPGSRPAQAPDGVVKGNDFLALFGRPQRDSACECARSSNLSLSHALNLVGGKTLHQSISAPEGRIPKLIAGGAGDAAVVTELYWAALCRPPTAAELAAVGDLGPAEDRLAAAQDLLWALTNSPAFLFNR